MTRSSFFTEWKPFGQAGKRHRSFLIRIGDYTAEWNNFSRPVVSVDISGVKSIAGVIDHLNADPIIPVTVSTWDPDNMETDNVPVTYHYMLQTGLATALDYIELYNNQRLLPQSRLLFWTAPPLYPSQTLARTKADIEILCYGQENPFNATGYVIPQQNITTTNTDLLYTEDYPVDGDPLIECNQFQIS